MFARSRLLLSKAALVAAAFAASSALFLAVGAAFHSASSELWLRESPQARLVAERCEALNERAARHGCVRAAVAQAQARDGGAAPLATAGLVPAAAR